MMPTTEQMLAAMQLALDEHVKPVAADNQWAASALRSVDAILNHLQVRVPNEGPFLHADNSDLLNLLGAAKTQLGKVVEGQEDFLDTAPALLSGYASVGDLQALNHRGRDAVDRLLRLCQSLKGDTAADAVHAVLRAYVLRHAEGESAYFFPVYVGRPV